MEFLVTNLDLYFSKKTGSYVLVDCEAQTYKMDMNEPSSYCEWYYPEIDGWNQARWKVRMMS